MFLFVCLSPTAQITGSALVVIPWSVYILLVSYLLDLSFCHYGKTWTIRGKRFKYSRVKVSHIKKVMFLDNYQYENVILASFFVCASCCS